MLRPALLILLLLTIFTSTAQAQRKICSSDDSAWLPSRYYDAGEIVFHDGNWYVAREWQEGRRPGSGEFAWQALDTPPECARTKESMDTEAELSKPGHGDESVPVFPADKTSGDMGKVKASETECKPAPAWTFSDSYSVGAWVTHEGQIYRAIRPSTGDMPGVVEPPHWAPVDADCPQEP